jgi:hypothetical protein
MATSIQKQYTRELLENLQYFGTWLPLVPLEVGAVGIIRSHTFGPQTTLQELGVSFQRAPGRPSGTLKHVSADGVEVDFKLAGEPPLTASRLAQADAGATVSFARSGGIYFEAEGCTVESIKNPVTLEQSLLKLFESKVWKKVYFVITELVRAKSVTVLISQSKNAKIELRAQGRLDASTASLASASARFSVAMERNLSTSIVGQQQLTPLFRASCLRFPLFRAPALRIETRGLQGRKPRAAKKVAAAPRLSSLGLKDLWRQD